MDFGFCEKVKDSGFSRGSFICEVLKENIKNGVTAKLLSEALVCAPGTNYVDTGFD